MTALSERIRPGIDAAPWVIQAIKELEQQLAARDAEMQATVGVGDGTGSLYVHGSYDAVKTVQAKLLELESVRRQLAAKDAELERVRALPDSWLRALAEETNEMIEGRGSSEAYETLHYCVKQLQAALASPAAEQAEHGGLTHD